MSGHLRYTLDGWVTCGIDYLFKCMITYLSFVSKYLNNMILCNCESYCPRGIVHLAVDNFTSDHQQNRKGVMIYVVPKWITITYLFYYSTFLSENRCIVIYLQLPLYLFNSTCETFVMEDQHCSNGDAQHPIWFWWPF